MQRSLWKGNISFGLISIPVTLNSAVHDHRARFRMLHSKDLSPIRYDHVCQREGHAVSWQDLVKGYEYEKGKFVVVTKDDFQTAALEKTQTIDIINFVLEEEVDDRFFVTPYYLQPGKGGEHAYALLREALRESGKIGIAKIILRQVQHLAALTAMKDALVLTMMRFSDELLALDTLKLPAVGPLPPGELQMAKTLIETLTDSFHAEQYTDEYQENLMRVIEAKLKGKRPALPAAEPEPEGNKVGDLMERLRDSLALAPNHGAKAARTAKKADDHGKDGDPEQDGGAPKRPVTPRRTAAATKQKRVAQGGEARIHAK